MKVWNSFPMLRLLTPFFLGVISWAFLLEVIEPSLLALLTSWAIVFLLGLLVVLIGNYSRRPYLFGLHFWPIIYSMGALLTLSVSDQVYPNHLGKKDSISDRGEFIAVIVEQPRVKPRSIEVQADIFDTKHEAFGTSLLYFTKDSLSENLKYGQELILRTNLDSITGMGNPNEFNYTRYLRFHHIQNRGFVQQGDWKILSDGKPGLKGWFLDLRSKMIEKLEEAGLSGSELSVASALILGYRAELDKELMMAYAGAGATHVLAVSGLHVGIVYIILNWLLRFLDRNKTGRIIKTILLVSLLFGYAALTGLSASVFRAATMFSFVAIGKALNRNTNIFNTLAASAFCLMLVDPYIIMQVGFQLSYLAVIGIVIIQPRLFQMLTFNNRLADWAWSITCVSIAAQITTFPLGLLYFHQFPNLFLLSNLLVIPAAAAILYLGFSLFVFSFWSPALLFFGFLLKWLIRLLNQAVVLIEKIPYSVMEGIDISTFEALLIYGLTASILIFIIHKKRNALYATFCMLIVLTAFQIIEYHEQHTQRFATIYNVKGETAIALASGKHVTFLARKELWQDEQKMLFHIRHHWWNKGIESEEFVELNDSLLNRTLAFGSARFRILKLGNDETMAVDMEDSTLSFIVIDHLSWKAIDRFNFANECPVMVSNKFGNKTYEKLIQFSENRIQPISNAAITFDYRYLKEEQ